MKLVTFEKLLCSEVQPAAGGVMMIIRIYDQQHFITTVVITMMTAMTLMTMDIMRMRTVIMISNVMTLWFSYRMVSLNCKRIQQFSSSSHIHHCHGHCWSVIFLDNHHQSPSCITALSRFFKWHQFPINI